MTSSGDMVDPGGDEEATYDFCIPVTFRYIGWLMQGGPQPVINGVITPISRVITYNPSYPFIRPFRRV